jgi:hypothetical protein
MQTTQPTLRPQLVKRGSQATNTVAQPTKRLLPHELRKVWQSERKTSTLSPRQQFNALFNS